MHVSRRLMHWPITAFRLIRPTWNRGIATRAPHTQSVDVEPWYRCLRQSSRFGVRPMFSSILARYQVSPVITATWRFSSSGLTLSSVSAGVWW